MRLSNQDYISEFVTNAEQAAFFANMPFWAEAAWVLGVGGGLIASVLLLARSRFAVPVYVISLIGLIGCTLYEYVLSSPQALEVFREDWKVAFVLLLYVIAVSLLLYAYRMQQKGVLR
jgi:hypothetical protein